MSETNESPIEGQANTSEVTSTEQVKPAERFNVFVQKEKQLRNRIRELEAREAAFKQKEAEFIPKKRLVDDPLSVLSEHGLSYEKLSEMIMSNPNSQDPSIQALRAEIRALYDRQAESEKAKESEQREQYERALNHIRNQVKLTVDGESDFETIRDAGMYEAVVDLIEETYRTDGVLMDVKQAAREVEDHLVNEALKMAAFKKVQERLKTPPAAPEAEPKVGMMPQKTLTNALSQEPAKKAVSEKDRIANAIAAFNRGKL